MARLHDLGRTGAHGDMAETPQGRVSRGPGGDEGRRTTRGRQGPEAPLVGCPFWAVRGAGTGFVTLLLFRTPLRVRSYSAAGTGKSGERWLMLIPPASGKERLMKRLIVLAFVLPLMLAMSQAPGNASETESLPTCTSSYCSRCDAIGGLCVQHSGFCDCHVAT